MCKRILAAAITILAVSPLAAQSEGGLIAGVEAEKKIDKRWSVGIDADLRTRNNFKTMDRWGVGLGVSYKLNKWLKADAGYKLLDYNNRDKVNYYTSSKGNAKVEWRPSYWGIKHRFYASLTGSYKFTNGLKLSLRERWQYNYRPEVATERYKGKVSDGILYQETDYTRNGKGKNQLRSRLELSYDKKGALLDPYASVELYNSWAIEKIRYTVGTDINLSKQHSLEVFYRYQNMKNVDDGDYEPDMHYIGVGYKFKF